MDQGQKLLNMVCLTVFLLENRNDITSSEIMEYSVRAVQKTLPFYPSLGILGVKGQLGAGGVLGTGTGGVASTGQAGEQNTSHILFSNEKISYNK